jgi:hypothetical protein
MISMQAISTSVVPWIEIDIDSSDCHTADEVYEKLRSHAPPPELMAHRRRLQ